MIETYGQAGAIHEHQTHQRGDHQKKILRMVKNDRMAGSLPSWGPPQTAKDNIAQNLGGALQTGHGGPAIENALALQASGAATGPQDEEFGFGDLIDMVNPLHHIPLVSSVYRTVTGDEIKPIGRIIGGGVFGGPVGMANGLVNVIAEEETGSDLAGNAYNIMMRGEKPNFKSQTMQPEQRLEQAQQYAQNPVDPLPESLLAFSDQGFKGINLSRRDDPDIAAERRDHIALTMAKLPPREPITQIDRSQKVPFREL